MNLDIYHQIIAIMNKNVIVITSMSGQVDISCKEFCLSQYEIFHDFPEIHANA